MLVRNRKEVIDTDKLTYEEMQALGIMLDEQTQAIETQLREAKVTLYQTGQRADDQWYSKATWALKATRRARQELQVLIGQRRRQMNLAQKALPDYFMDAAYECLPIEDFERIKAIAASKREEALEGMGA